MNNLGVIGPLSTREHDVSRSRTAEEQAGVEAAQARRDARVQAAKARVEIRAKGEQGKADVVTFLFIGVFFTLIGGFVLGLLSADETAWEQLPDERCVMRVENVNRLFAPDYETRTEYCRS